MNSRARLKLDWRNATNHVFVNNRWHGTDWALTFWVIVIVPSVENRWFRRLSCDAMAEPPLKKQKLTSAWFLEQLQDLELNEELKKSAADCLAKYPEDVLRKSSLDTLSFYLQNAIGDENLRLVVGCMHHRIKEDGSASAPVPRTQSLFCSFNPIKCFFGVGRFFVEIGDWFSVVVSVFNNIFHIPDWLRLFQSRQTPSASGWTRQWRGRQSQASGKLMKCRSFPTAF